MGDLTKNFSAYEFTCKGGNLCCGGSVPMSERLLEGLQELRDLIGRPVIVSSGFRCLKYNRRLLSSDSSQHTLGRAADIWVRDMDPNTLASYAEQIEHFRNGGIGIYNTFVHVDVRRDISRWRGKL